MSAYADALASTDPQRAYGLLQARFNGAKQITVKVADWVSEYAALHARHSSELQRFISRSVLAESELGTLAAPWQSLVEVAVEKVRSGSELSNRITREVEQPIRQSIVGSEVERLLTDLSHRYSSSTVNGLQSLDEHRLQALKDGLTRLTTLEVDSAQGVIAATEPAVQSLITFEPSEDIQSYVAKVVSGIAPIATPIASSSRHPAANSRVASAATTADKKPSRKVSRGSLLMNDNASTTSSARNKSGASKLRAKVGSIFGRKPKPRSAAWNSDQASGTPEPDSDAAVNRRHSVQVTPSIQPPDFGFLGGAPARTPSPERSRRSTEHAAAIHRSPSSASRQPPAPPPARHSVHVPLRPEVLSPAPAPPPVQNGPLGMPSHFSEAGAAVQEQQMSAPNLNAPALPEQSLNRQSSLRRTPSVNSPVQPLRVHPSATPDEDEPFFFPQNKPSEPSPVSPSRNVPTSSAVTETPRQTNDEQFYTPAQYFAPQFPSQLEAANGSVVSLTSSTFPTSGTSLTRVALPPAPMQQGLVGSVLERITAQWSESGKLVAASASGDVVVQLNPGGDIPARLVVSALGTVLEIEPAAPQISQLTANTFEFASPAEGTTTELAKYTVSNAEQCVPLQLVPQWRIETHQARLMLSYSLPETWRGSETVEISDLVVTVSISGGHARAAQSKPMATFSRERQRVTWRFAQPIILRRGQTQRLLCQFSTEAPAEPSAVTARITLSSYRANVALQLLDEKANAWLPIPLAAAAAADISA